jgi:hypothetical protein
LGLRPKHIELAVKPNSGAAAREHGAQQLGFGAVQLSAWEIQHLPSASPSVGHLP